MTGTDSFADLAGILWPGLLSRGLFKSIMIGMMYEVEKYYSECY